MIKKFEPPFLLNPEHSFIEDKIKNFSSNLFTNKIFGIFTVIQFNIYIINCILKNKNLITIFLELFLLYLLQYIVMEKIYKKKKK